MQEYPNEIQPIEEFLANVAKHITGYLDSPIGLNADWYMKNYAELRHIANRLHAIYKELNSPVSE